MHYGRDDRAGEKPKWQRARILSNCVLGTGREIWVATGAPEIVEGVNPLTEFRNPPRKRVLMNVQDDGDDILIRADQIERHARDENDFAEDVPLIPWQEFLAECRKEQEPDA